MRVVIVQNSHNYSGLVEMVAYECIRHCSSINVLTKSFYIKYSIGLHDGAINDRVSLLQWLIIPEKVYTSPIIVVSSHSSYLVFLVKSYDNSSVPVYYGGTSILSHRITTMFDICMYKNKDIIMYLPHVIGLPGS